MSASWITSRNRAPHRGRVNSVLHTFSIPTPFPPSRFTLFQRLASGYRLSDGAHRLLSLDLLSAFTLSCCSDKRQPGKRKAKRDSSTSVTSTEGCATVLSPPVTASPSLMTGTSSLANGTESAMFSAGTSTVNGSSTQFAFPDWKAFISLRRRVTISGLDPATFLVSPISFWTSKSKGGSCSAIGSRFRVSGLPERSLVTR